MLDADLKAKVNRLWDKFWSGGISNPLQAIEQMSYLLFMKQLEDEDNERMRNARYKNETYDSLFTDCSDCKWSVWTHYPAERILDHVNEVVFPFLKGLGGQNSLYAKYMKDAVFIIPTPGLLIEAVNIIDSMHINDKDTKGDLYEYLLSELKTSGKNGQFRTPRHIIKMMVELIDPKIGEIICDPACGTAGFLITAYEYILRENTSTDTIEYDEEGNEFNLKGDNLSKKQWRILSEDTFYGYDIDQVMTRISLMNLIMHGIKNPHVEHLNTLSSRYDELNTYDVVLANPPFKGSIDESEISENFFVKTKKTELLFLELMYNILSNGGRCAVIVPDGVLFRTTKAYNSIRKKLLEDSRLDAVISMPAGVFKPYAGVSTGILIFTKGEPTDKVWFYDMGSDGYTLDDKRDYIDGKGDIPDIIQKFKIKDSQTLNDRKSKCFYVTYDEIKENDYILNVSRYKEPDFHVPEYKDPVKLLDEILTSENKIIRKVQTLQDLIKVD